MADILTKEGLKHYTAGMKSRIEDVTQIGITGETDTHTAVVRLTNALNKGNFSLEGMRPLIVTGDTYIGFGFCVKLAGNSKRIFLDFCNEGIVKKVILTYNGSSWVPSFVEKD